MSFFFLIIALVFFVLVALKIPEPAIPSWIGAGLVFLTLALMFPHVEVYIK